MEVSEIASGGMGSVYRARDTVLDRMVAIKVMIRDDARVQDIQRLQREATAAARLSHGNLVAVLDFGIAEDTSPYLVMEYVEGPTLKEKISEKGQLDVGTTLDLVAQIARGLDHAHRHGVIHRDLKPANIVITGAEDGSPLARVIDFGIARLEGIDESGRKLTRTNAIVGSPLYMSPEQVRGEPADERSDIYSLGCIVFECLTGMVPFRGTSALETMRMHVEEPPPPVCDASGNTLPAPVENLITRALSKAPEDRYQTMAEFLSDIEAAQEVKAVSARELNEFTVKPEPMALPVSLLVKIIPVAATIFCGIVLGCQILRQSNEVSPRVEVPAKGTPFERDLHSNKVNGPDSVKISITTDEAIDWDKIDSWRQGKRVLLELEVSKIPLSQYKQIASHPDIYGICLRDCNISNKILEDLSVCKNLMLVSLDGSSGFTAVGLAHLQRLPGLKELTLSKTNLNDDFCQVITPLKRLTHLNLKGNRDLSDKSIIPICKSLTELQNLHLANTGITDDAMLTIASLRHLKTLMLGHTAISDVGIGHLRSNSLERVSLIYTNVTVDGVSRLTGLKGMKCIWVPKSILESGIRNRGRCIIRSSE